MKVQDIMSATLRSASPNDSLRVVAQMMREEDAGFIPVSEGDQLVGVITDRDIVVRCLAEGHDGILEEAVEHCMTRAPVSIDANADVEQAASLMKEHQIRRLPVLDGERLVGVLSHGNLVQATDSSGPADEATLAVTSETDGTET